MLTFYRIFWSIIIVISFLFGSYILAELLVRFFRAPIQITRADPELLMNIPYPAITLCHPQSVITSKAKPFVDSMWDMRLGMYWKNPIWNFLPAEFRMESISLESYQCYQRQSACLLRINGDRLTPITWIQWTKSWNWIDWAFLT